MPISVDIIERLRNNDSSLVHLDLTSQVKLSLIHYQNRYVPYLDDESERLTDADILELSESLTHNTCLKSLILNKNQVGLLGITALVTTRLEKLAIRQNGLNSDCVDALMLSETLIELDVADNLLRDEDIAKLAKNRRLTTLDVSENTVGPLSMTAFGGNTTLTKLVIRKTRFEMHAERFINLAPLGFNTTLKCLEITGTVIATLAPLSGHPELERLNLEDCSIGDNSVDAFVPLLHIPKLSWLSIRGTESSGRDMDHVAELLANIPLLYLDISETEMSALGAKALARSPTLTTLIASKNYIGGFGLVALAGNKNITRLDISQNNTKRINSDNIKILRRNEEEIWQGRTSMNYDEVELGRENLKIALMLSFEQNKSWKVLNMSNMRFRWGSYITDERLAGFIRNNTTLESLDISHNSYHVKLPVLDALAENKTLERVTFSCDLDRKDNRLALSKNDSLKTIQCYKAYEIDKRLVQQPYAQEIQERNRHIPILSFLMLHAMNPERSRSRLIENIDFLCHIGSFLVSHPHCINKAYSHALTLFDRRPMERASKRMRIEGPDMSMTASSSLNVEK